MTNILEPILQYGPARLIEPRDLHMFLFLYGTYDHSADLLQHIMNDLSNFIEQHTDLSSQETEALLALVTYTNTERICSALRCVCEHFIVHPGCDYPSRAKVERVVIATLKSLAPPVYSSGVTSNAQVTIDATLVTDQMDVVWRNAAEFSNPAHGFIV